VHVRAGPEKYLALESEMTQDEAPTVGFTIFRAKDAPGLMEAACMSIAPRTEIQAEGLKQVMAAGYGEGEQCKVLVNLPGFSLTHAWMKTNYPLTLHSHDSDCLYYVVAGDLTLGTEELGPQDCFFVPAGVPYTYRPGPNGVEVLEFRHATQFDFVNYSKSAAFYDKAAKTCAANLETWRSAKPPSQMA
jgi:mannose-6-phosphate isomerase-like protein (cupin superfamily)